MRIGGYLILLVLAVGCSIELPNEVEIAYNNLPEVIDYNFHVKPILSDRCYACHGPDEASRKAGLRLDVEEEAFTQLSSGNHAFKVGSPGDSEAISRILSENSDKIMPPPSSKLTLQPEEIATIVKWVEQGAKWKDHWSFIPPAQTTPPNQFPQDWKTNNAIDNFIYTKINSAALAPSPTADKERLLRRVYMDLTGLPPTIQQIDAFLADESEEAYDKVVDQLLQSPHYGERIALDWMDLSRYADSHGLHADGWRNMWPWRDWVINALNDNMPYDQFVTWQLAGDLLPNATQEQILATAFHRNHPMTAEGGVVDEEFRLEYVADRTNTTSTAFLGLTMECAKCHDHKFDPISQEEYYMMSAFFNNVKELGMTGDDGNYGPMLLMTDSKTQTEINRIESLIKKKENELMLTEEQVDGIRQMISSSQVENSGLVGYFPFESKQQGKVNAYSVYGGTSKEPVEKLIFDGNQNAYSNGTPELTEGKKGNALSLGIDFNEVYLKKVGLFELHEQYSGMMWASTSQNDSLKTQALMGTAGEKNNFWRGWDFFLDENNHLSFRLIHSLPHNYIQVTTEDEISVDRWYHLAFTYDGSGKGSGVDIFINGKKAKAKIEFDDLYKSILPVKVTTHTLDDRDVRVGKSYRSYTGENGIYKGRIDEIRFYDRVLTESEVKAIAGLQSNNEQIASTGSAYRKKLSELNALRKDWLNAIKDVPEVMVMGEMPVPRKTFLLGRGEYNSPIKQVALGTPREVLPYPDELPRNRLGLAQWLFREDNPLTARVTVNRYWQLIFGKGLVKTLNDFGNQGALPSHPELLDWLAVEFMKSGWDIKQLIKLMVSSNTYRQSSKASNELREIDPENILLARSPSYRWPAELIRDNALAASGLLSKKIGGPSVKPYQPPGLWIELGNFSYKLLNYKEDTGEDLYRRSLYTFVRRTSPPPYMSTFDAPNRDVCTVQRERTNTPLQALILLNDPQFVEAARVLAERVQSETNTLDEQLINAFRYATGRSPIEDEVEIFRKLYNEEESRFKENPTEARALLGVGEKVPLAKYDLFATSALSVVTNTMLNHDEAYMKR